VSKYFIAIGALLGLASATAFGQTGTWFLAHDNYWYQVGSSRFMELWPILPGDLQLPVHPIPIQGASGSA
jgi:hypothetical protein